MKKMTIKSKQAQRWLAAYNAATYYDVTQVYANPSSAKIEADYECWQKCQREEGLGYRIISATTHCFTVAWMTYGRNLRVETAFNSYLIKL